LSGLVAGRKPWSMCFPVVTDRSASMRLLRECYGC
jgi:hypothetical protein